MKAYFFRSILPLIYSSVLTVAICLRVFAQDPALAPPEPPQWTVLEDADQDGLTDWDEFLLSLDPLNPLDGLSDADGDELWLAWEWYLGTHSDLADTDGDGWSDSLEVLLYGTDPLDPVSKPLGNGAEDHGDAAAALEPEQTPTPEEDLPPPPPPSLSNGDFTDIGIQTWKDQSTSKSYQGGGFQWGEGTASSWSAYVGNTIEVWQANGETFVELDGNTSSYGIKQPIANARAGAFILAWKQSGRNDTKSGTNPYYVRIYHESDKGPVIISDSKEFSGYDKLKWTDNIHVFQITPEQIAAAAGKPIYAAFIPTSLNTYGTLIDKVALLSIEVTVLKDGQITAPVDGLIVKQTDTVRYRLSPTLPDVPLLLEDKIQWNWRILKWDGTYSEWTAYVDGQGHTFTAQPKDSGIYEVKATLEGQDFFLYRKKDDPYSAKKKDENDCFGVVDEQWQINVGNSAKKHLGSKAYAKAANNSPYKKGSWKCNQFVGDKVTGGGCIVPLINGNNPLRKHYPLANQWAGTDTKHIPNWTLLPRETYPQPGWVIARGVTGGTGHTGIIGYDGAWVGAGKYNVNRNADLRDAYYNDEDPATPEEPARFRKYTP